MTVCFGLLLAPVSWVPCWVWIAPVQIAPSSWLQATWRDAGWERWAVAAIIAVFASTYSVPISEQRHRTIDSFLFFMLSNPYVLTAIAIALALGAAGVLRAKPEKF